MKPTIAVLAVAGALAAIAGWALGRERNGRLEAERKLEAAQLELKHQIVSADASAAELRGRVGDLAAGNASLKKALDDAQRAAPAAAPVLSASLATDPLTVAAAPRSVESAAPRAPSATTASLPPASSAPECSLAAGDRASIAVDVVELQTKAGNTLVVGTAEAWRESPLPRARLFGGAFRAPASRVESLAPPAAEPRWGIGLLGACGTPGCALGPVVLFPPVKLLLRLEASAGAAVGPGGAYLVVSLGARF